MRHAGIMARGENKSRGQFGASLSHPQPDLRVHVSNRQGSTIFLEQDLVISNLTWFEIVCSLADHRRRDLSHSADTPYLNFVFRFHGTLEDAVLAGHPDKLQRGECLLQIFNDQLSFSHIRVAEYPDPAV